MINKLCIPKNVLVVISCALSWSLTSQIPYNPSPGNFSGSYSSGTQNNYSYNATLNTLNASSAAAYDIKASSSIGVLPGSSAANFSSGSFGAHIDKPPFEVVSYHPNGFNNIPLYDKFELGIKLPQGLTDSVNKFFGDTNYVGTAKYSCINGYGNKFNNTSSTLNPYDPDKISVEATFSFPGKPSQTIYGFYYREYSYAFANGSTVSYLNTNWLENTNLQYHWRVRFAPKYIGTYTVTWKIKTNNGATIAYQDNIGQAFSTASSNSLGFLKIGTNGKFLVTQPEGDPSQKTIIPVGTCYTFPQDGFITTDSTGAGLNDDVPSGDCGTTGYSYGCIFADNYIYPSRYYKNRKKIRERMANQGANYVRIFNMYCSYDFEWEKAGVYDADPKKPLGAGIPNNANPYAQNYKGVNRQAVLWEFDSLVDMAKNKNLYIQWVFEDMANGFDVVNSPRYPTWKGDNPYRDIVTQPKDTTSVTQFFTDANAIKMYKKKLRYLIARYGYATSIASFEMFNEFHILHASKGGNIASLDNTFKPWLDTMLHYIKKPYGLNHNDHLCTASYEIGNTGDNVGLLSGLDFFSTHPYNNNGSSFKIAFDNTQTFKINYSKPCQAGELGIQSAWECIARSQRNKPQRKTSFPEYMAPTFHTLLWSTTFIGGLTSGLEMWSPVGLDIDPGTQSYHSCGDGFIQHFKPLQAFIKDINFDQSNYVPKYLDMEPMGAKIEAFYLIDNIGVQADHIVGYVRNKTFWWSNFTNSNSGLPYYNPVSPNELKIEYDSLYLPLSSPPNTCSSIPVSLPSASAVLSGNLGALHIYGLKPNTLYTVDWYDTYNDPAVQNPYVTSANVTSTGSGLLVIIPPTFVGCAGQEYGFKIHPFGQARSASATNAVQIKDETSKKNNTNSLLSIAETEMQIAGNDIKIYPNPASDKLFIKYDAEIFKDVTLALYDLSGRLILKQNSTKELSTANLENGAYMVKFSSDNFFKTFKINVMH